MYMYMYIYIYTYWIGHALYSCSRRRLERRCSNSKRGKKALWCRQSLLKCATPKPKPTPYRKTTRRLPACCTMSDTAPAAKQQPKEHVLHHVRPHICRKWHGRVLPWGRWAPEWRGVCRRVLVVVACCRLLRWVRCRRGVLMIRLSALLRSRRWAALVEVHAEWHVFLWMSLVWVWAYAYTCTHTHIHIHTRTHAHTLSLFLSLSFSLCHTHTHTHIHTHTHARAQHVHGHDSRTLRGNRVSQIWSANLLCNKMLCTKTQQLTNTYKKQANLRSGTWRMFSQLSWCRHIECVLTH